MAEVATHNAADDCWIVISGKVYDITGWLPYHPGESRGRAALPVLPCAAAACRRLPLPAKGAQATPGG